MKSGNCDKEQMDIDDGSESELIGFDEHRFGDIVIDPELASKAFFELSTMFYDHNFGSRTKADIELVMFKWFKIFAEKAHKKETVTELFLARRLGITPQMVRNRLTKLVLQGQSEQKSWTDSFLTALEERTYILRKSKDNCEMKLMFPSKMDVFEFEDVLKRRGHFFDNTFNNLVVITPMSAIFDILYRELEGIDPPPGAKEMGMLSYLRQRLSKNQTNDARINGIIDDIWGTEAFNKASDAAKKGGLFVAKAVTRTLIGNIGLSDIKDCAENLKTLTDNVLNAVSSDSNNAEEQRSLLGNIKKIADIFELPNELNLDEKTFSKDDLKSIDRMEGEENVLS